MFQLLISIPLFALLMLGGCSPSTYRPALGLQPQAQRDPIQDLLESMSPTAAEEKPLRSLGYSIQVGAFSSLDNASAFEALLQNRGIDAFYFKHESGLYKVRFGNHERYRDARDEAERLRAQGLIEEFFVVVPESYAAARIRSSGSGDLRQELIDTARRFLGVPYRWGGTSAENGFDCSGLTLVSYRLNGLDLPRVSYMQAKAGRYVPKSDLRPGDLVFFATNGGAKISHVGMYIGEGRFIHAPRKGKTVRIAALSAAFWQKTYVTGRTYL